MPLYYMGRVSLEEGSIFTGFQFAWNFPNYTDAISSYDEQLLRSFYYAGAATVMALLIGYPARLCDRLPGRQVENALLLLVIVPFFTTYLVRTLAWQTILADDGDGGDVLQFVGVLGETAACWRPRVP